MRRAILASALLVASVATGCRRDDATPRAAGPKVPMLEGRTFLSTAVTEAGSERPLVAGTRINLTFDRGTVRVSAGCNTMGGGYTLDGTSVVVTDGAQTAMGCDQARSTQDAWLFGLLRQRPTLTAQGDELLLAAGSTVIALRDKEVLIPDRPLTGVRWKLSSIIQGSDEQGSASSVNLDAWIEFADNGTWSANFACNSGSGKYVVDGDRITTRDGMRTLIGCTDGRESVDATMIATLSAGPTFTIDGNQLSLRTGTGGLDFEATP